MGNELFSKRYLEFAQRNPGLKLTNNQHQFAEFLIKNKNEVTNIGNMEFVFKIISQDLKQ